MAHLVSQALSRGEAKDSILLSSRDRYLLAPASPLNRLPRYTHTHIPFQFSQQLGRFDDQMVEP